MKVIVGTTFLAILFCAAIGHADAAACAGACHDGCQQLDTVVNVRGNDFCVKSVARDEFKRLKALHYREPSFSVHSPDSVRMMLPPGITAVFDTLCYDGMAGYVLREVRKEETFRILLGDEVYGEIEYFPVEGIMVYYEGHSSENAFFVDTGKHAYYPPASALSDDGRYRVGALFSGQDNNDYKMEKYDPEGKYYVNLGYLYEINERLWDKGCVEWWAYVFEQFIAGDAFYFRTGYERYDDPEDNEREYKYYSVTFQ